MVDHAADRSDGGVNQVHRDSQVRDGTFIQGTLPVDRSSTVPQLQTVEPTSHAQVLKDPVHQDIPPPVGGVAATTSVPSTVYASAIPKDPVLQDIPPPVGGVATTTLGPSTTGEEGTKPQDIVSATKDIPLWEGETRYYHLCALYQRGGDGLGVSVVPGGSRTYGGSPSGSLYG